MARGSGVGFGWFVNSQGQTMMVVSWPDKPECSGTTRFAISSTEVTWRQFRAFRPEVVSSRYADPSADDQPVYDVDFHSARAYCEWLSRRESLERPFEYRLPTLEEWRFAAAAGASTARHFGDRATFLPEYAQSLVNSGGRPQPVARRKPNDFGLFDTLGNVHEWTLSIEPRRDLPDLHIAAGGSCAVLGENLHTDLQIATIPETTTLLTGFRIVQSLALSE